MDKKNIIKGVIIGLSLVIILIVILMLNKSNGNKTVNDYKITDEIKGYGYKLDENKTKIYKNLFKELNKILEKDEIDYNEYAKTISKMFIADFYDFNSKISKNDIGGLDFVHSNIKTNFILNAQNTIYNHIESNIYGNRKQELPIVKSIEVLEMKNTAYTYGGITDNNAYNIKLKWVYKKDLGYQNEATIVIVKEEKKLSIVELQ